MAVKLADTLKPMGDFPAAESSDIELTLADGTKKSIQRAYLDGDLGGEGTNIQVTEMPVPSGGYSGKIYQYIGPTVSTATGLNYVNGYFYKCVLVRTNFQWQLCDVSKTKAVRVVDELPTEGIEDAIYAKKDREFTNFPTHKFIPGATASQSVNLMKEWLTSIQGFGFHEEYDSDSNCQRFFPIEQTLYMFFPTQRQYHVVVELWVNKSENNMDYAVKTSTGVGISGTFEQNETYSFKVSTSSKRYYEGEYSTQDITPLPGVTGVSDVNELPESGSIENGIYRVRDGESKSVLCTGTFEEIKQRLTEAGFTVSETTDPEFGSFYYQVTPPAPIDVYVPNVDKWFWPGQYYKLVLGNTSPASASLYVSRNERYLIGGLNEDKSLIYRESGKKKCYVGDSELQKLDELGGGGAKIFYGSDEEWDALSVDEKKEYDYKADSEEAASSNSELMKMPGVQNFLASKKRYSNVSSVESNNTSQFCTFLHITDIHEDSERYLIGRKLADACKVDGVLMTGDIVASTSADDFSFVTDNEGSFTTPLYTCVGNHDAKNMDENGVYGKYILPFVARYGYNNVVGTSSCNWYHDITQWKLRVVGLQPYQNSADPEITGHYLHYTQEIFSFLGTVLKQTPQDYGVVILMHSPEKALHRDYQFDLFKQPETFFWTEGSGYSALTQLVDEWISGNSGTITHVNSLTDGSSVTYNYDFTGKNSGTEFIAWVTGHTHSDNIGYVPGTENKQLMLNMACSGLQMPSTYDVNEYNDLAREEGTDSECLFNMYVIDRERKLVKITRIGAHLTYDLIDRNYMQIEYK